jgi:hypothetical protein
MLRGQKIMRAKIRIGNGQDIVARLVACSVKSIVHES